MARDNRRMAAKRFAEFWKGKGYEKGQSQPFWLSLLRDVFDVEHPEEFISFEDQVHLDSTSFIDGYIPATHVLIEQKSIDKSLSAAIRQSDGTMLDPFQQAKRYSANLPYSSRPRWIVTCNFKEFYVYDMERPNGEPEKILLEDLEKEYYRLEFLVDVGNENIRKEMEISLQAGELVGKLYDAILKQYINPEDPASLKSLNMLCVRLVFCLYAEDAGVFGPHNMFHDYLEGFLPENMRMGLIELFKVLDTRPEDRDPYMKPELAAFPYVNGGLFAEEDIEIPMFTEEIRQMLLQDASADFDWSGISPTIFGAMFESTLNPETRRSGGMHYTSIENIHKVIDPLFLDDLKEEFAEIQAIAVNRTRKARLEAFHDKLASLTFLDPACGSGNFLTETYISLRRLENEILKLQLGGEIVLGAIMNPIKVSIKQFYGIEINDFAATVAKAALWIAESQMMQETEDIVHMNLDFLPLKTYANIVEGNALRMDWESVVSRSKLNYIMGNPPFLGYSMQSKEQKADMRDVYTDERGKTYKKAGKIDYVAGWYFKAAEMMDGTKIVSAFVSTNSITQGDQVEGVWKPLMERFSVRIEFAWRTFKWDSESNNKAAVHCVIIGFSCHESGKKKYIYNDVRSMKEAKNISPYLLDLETVFVESRTSPLCSVPVMVSGNRPADGGNLIIEQKEYEAFVKKEPGAKEYIRPLLGADEFIKNKKRWCLWLVGVAPDKLQKLPLVLKRIEKVRAMRLKSTKKATRDSAATPTLFQEIHQPVDKKILLIPSVSSERRRYVPMGFLQGNTIATNLVTIVPGGGIYEFGILTSNVHNAWMRTVAGRLEMRYRYSKDIVYNNFPWPNPTEKQKVRIEQTAQGILDARDLYTDSSLADLYNELTMPPELRKAHQANDKAVMEAYGFWGKLNSESECVAELMKMYQKLVEQEKK